MMDELEPMLELAPPMYVVPCPHCVVDSSAVTEAAAYALHGAHMAEAHDDRTYTLSAWSRGTGWTQVQTGASRAEALIFVQKHADPKVIDESTGEAVSHV